MTDACEPTASRIQNEQAMTVLGDVAPASTTLFAYLRLTRSKETGFVIDDT